MPRAIPLDFTSLDAGPPGEITEEKLALLRKADAILIEEIRAAGLYDAICQASITS